MVNNSTPVNSNIIQLSGIIISEFTLSHEIYCEKFYRAILSAKRTSGVEDKIPIVVSEQELDMSKSYLNKKIQINGQLRTYNLHEDNKSKLLMYVLIKEYEFVDEIEEDVNVIIAEGYICKDVIYRRTPNGREITEIVLAMNRNFRKSDYIHCIAWGENARKSRSFCIGDKVECKGRFQSREYKKAISETEYEIKTAYEISLDAINII